MPVTWRLHVLEETLVREFGGVFTVESLDLYGLSPLDQHAAIQAIMETGGDFPVVLVDGCVACVGDIETDAIAAAAARRLTIDRHENEPQT
jgi:hypothetical protein